MRVTWWKFCLWSLDDYLLSQPSVGQFLNYTLLNQDRVTWWKPCSSDLLVPGGLSAVTAICWAVFNLLCQVQVTWQKLCFFDLLGHGGPLVVTTACWAIFKLRSSLPGASHVAETLLFWSPGTWRTICSHSHLLGNFWTTLFFAMCESRGGNPAPLISWYLEDYLKSQPSVEQFLNYTLLCPRCESRGGNPAHLIFWYLEYYLQSKPSVGYFLNSTIFCQVRITWWKPCSSDLLVPRGLSAVTAICWTIFKLHSSLPGASHVAETLLLWSPGTSMTICSQSHLLGNF